ncbi:MAG: DNRLRE domain-containing protein [Euryarchaeota archaeon]|nr:DNRLRE domain-containing protein [Euryarchaeota archaeon]
MRSLFVTGCVLMCAVLLIGATSAGSFTTKLGEDVYVDADMEDANYGVGTTLWVSSDDGDPVKITYLKFMNNLENVGVESGDDIESASLKIYVTDVETEGDIIAYFSEEDFFEETETWSDELEYLEDATATLYIDEEGWCTFDATEIMKMAADECLTCPFAIVLVAEDGASICFASKEESDGNEAVLDYTTSG